MGIPFRMIPKAMQRKAKSRPRWVSGHMSPYPTVEMLTLKSKHKTRQLLRTSKPPFYAEDRGVIQRLVSEGQRQYFFLPIAMLGRKERFLCNRYENLPLLFPSLKTRDGVCPPHHSAQRKVPMVGKLPLLPNTVNSCMHKLHTI